MGSFLVSKLSEYETYFKTAFETSQEVYAGPDEPVVKLSQKRGFSSLRLRRVIAAATEQWAA